MEQYPKRGMTTTDLIERIVTNGIASVTTQFEEGPKLEGSVAGFELARTIGASYEDFAWIVAQRTSSEQEMRLTRANDDASTNAYWRHRWATVQLEYCRDILLAARYAANQLPPETSVSARAVRDYARIVGM